MCIINLGNADKNNLIYKNNINKYYIEDDEIDIENKNSAPSIIANQIKHGSVVLDVGCSQGTLGKFLKNQKECVVYGIEIDEEASKIAMKTNSYEKIYNFSIEDILSEKYLDFFKEKLKFDYIIFADVLEHLYRPDQVLFEFQKKLKYNGEILVSIPNIAHYDIIHGLFNDKFNYSQVGILDNTHLRFFTKQSFIQFIAEINEFYKCNLDLIYVDSSILVPEFSVEYNELNKVIYLKDNINVLQNIFRIIKNKEGTTKNLNELLNEEKIDIFKVLNQKMIEYCDKDEIILNKQQEINNCSNIITNQIRQNEKLNNQILDLNEQILNLKTEIDEKKCLINQKNDIIAKYEKFIIIKIYKLIKKIFANK